MKNKGIIALNKPKGFTSFDCVNKIKHIVKPLKVGHLGTLDPMATGVLLITVGKATKLFDIMQQKTKTYIAKFEFGYSTDTLDSLGNIEEKTNNIPSLDDINNAINEFIGETYQVPPKYSAKLINGKRAYDLARNNVEFELKPKLVKINEIKILDYNNKILTLQIECGSGTYIRSIGRDLATKLNSLATMIELERTKIDSITKENCCTINDLNNDNWQNYIIDIDNILKYEELIISDEIKQKLLNGLTFEINKPNGKYILKIDDEVVAIIEIENFIAKMSIFLG